MSIVDNLKLNFDQEEDDYDYDEVRYEASDDIWKYREQKQKELKNPNSDLLDKHKCIKLLATITQNNKKNRSYHKMGLRLDVPWVKQGAKNCNSLNSNIPSELILGYVENISDPLVEQFKSNVAPVIRRLMIDQICCDEAVFNAMNCYTDNSCIIMKFKHDFVLANLYKTFLSVIPNCQPNTRCSGAIMDKWVPQIIVGNIIYSDKTRSIVDEVNTYKGNKIKVLGWILPPVKKQQWALPQYVKKLNLTPPNHRSTQTVDYADGEGDVDNVGDGGNVGKVDVDDVDVDVDVGEFGDYTDDYVAYYNN